MVSVMSASDSMKFRGIGQGSSNWASPYQRGGGGVNFNLDKFIMVYIFLTLGKYSATCLKRPLKILMTIGSLMKVESIAECSRGGGGILQYF